LIARARTGTGKTLSFVLPVHELMVKLKQAGELKQARGRGPACIVLSPTRELARQITKVFEMVAAGSFTVLPVYGGVPYIEQERPLQNGVDIVVGTPGRVIDLFDRSKLNITQIRYFVLDEADEMLNVGFKDSVDKLFEAVNESADKRGFPLQTLLFSATVPEWISNLTSKYFRKGLTETVDLVKGEKGPTTATRINHLCIPCPWSSRARTIGDIVLCYAGQHGRTIIFTETKKEANELALDDAIKQVGCMFFSRFAARFRHALVV
jgi:ATP-dependent RNA helicase DDX21